jgi:hypothetical protein
MRNFTNEAHVLLTEPFEGDQELMSACFETVNETLFGFLRLPRFKARSDMACHELRRRIDQEGGRLLKLMPLPAFFDRMEAGKVSQAAARLVGIQTQIIRDLVQQCGKEDLLIRFGVPLNLRRFVNWAELLEPQCFVGRADFLISDKGVHFCEFNVDSSVAGAELFDIGRAYLGRIGAQTDNTVRSPLSDLAYLLAANAKRLDSERIVLLDWSTDGGSAGKGYFSFDSMRDYVASATSLPVYIADDQSFDPAWLLPGHGCRTLVFRACTISDMDDEGAFLDRMLTAGCKVFGTVEGEIRTDKAWFALYHDEAIKSRLSAEDKALIEAMIPYTVQVSSKNLNHLLSEKDGLIFKQRATYGGAGILVGAETAGEHLKETLLSAGPETWVAQQMIKGMRLTFPHEPGGSAEPHEMVFGLYVYGDRHNGVLVRGSTSSKIVNASSGLAGVGWALCLDPLSRARMENEMALHLE